MYLTLIDGRAGKNDIRAHYFPHENEIINASAEGARAIIYAFKKNLAIKMTFARIKRR